MYVEDGPRVLQAIIDKLKYKESMFRLLPLIYNIDRPERSESEILKEWRIKIYGMWYNSRLKDRVRTVCNEELEYLTSPHIAYLYKLSVLPKTVLGSNEELIHNQIEFAKVKLQAVRSQNGFQFRINKDDNQFTVYKLNKVILDQFEEDLIEKNLVLNMDLSDVTDVFRYLGWDKSLPDQYNIFRSTFYTNLLGLDEYGLDDISLFYDRSSHKCCLIYLQNYYEKNYTILEEIVHKIIDFPKSQNYKILKEYGHSLFITKSYNFTSSDEMFKFIYKTEYKHPIVIHYMTNLVGNFIQFTSANDLHKSFDKMIMVEKGKVVKISKKCNGNLSPLNENLAQLESFSHYENIDISDLKITRNSQLKLLIYIAKELSKIQKMI